MQPVLNGIANFSQASFTGFIGRCSMHFEARFHESMNPMASNESEVKMIQVIATTMKIQRQLPMGTLIGGRAYSFSGQKSQ
jgi:hypothetical protein